MYVSDIRWLSYCCDNRVKRERERENGKESSCTEFEVNILSSVLTVELKTTTT